VTSPTTPPPTATSSDFRSAPARTSFRVSNSTVARFFAASASSNKCTTGAAPLAKLPANAFPTARHTFGELTTCTLENLPSFAISRPALRSNPAAHTTPYLPALALTQTVRTFARIFAFFISRNSLSPQCITIPHGLEGAPSFAPYAKGGLLRSDASTSFLFHSSSSSLPGAPGTESVPGSWVCPVTRPTKYLRVYPQPRRVGSHDRTSPPLFSFSLFLFSVPSVFFPL